MMQLWILGKLGNFFKSLPCIRIRPGRLTSRCSTNWNKTCSHKDLHWNLHSSFIQNSPKLETIQMSINWWADKQIMVYLHNRVSRSTRKQWVIYNTVHESQKHLLSERSHTQKGTHTSYALIEMKWVLERQTYSDRKHIHGGQTLAGR